MLLPDRITEYKEHCDYHEHHYDFAVHSTPSQLWYMADSLRNATRAKRLPGCECVLSIVQWKQPLAARAERVPTLGEGWGAFCWLGVMASEASAVVFSAINNKSAVSFVELHFYWLKKSMVFLGGIRYNSKRSATKVTVGLRPKL